MARFYLTARNGRGGTQSIGGRASVEFSHTRGWNSGVEVECFAMTDDDGNPYDRFDVYMTPGSTGNGHRVLLGSVVENSKRNPRWKPAKGRKNVRKA